MAKTFSKKNFFKKINQSQLLTELYKAYEITAIFEITENTPRKNAVAIMSDFHDSLSPEQKIEIEPVMQEVFKTGDMYARDILEQLLKEKNISLITTMECVTDLDYVLYYYLFHKEIFDDLAFFHTFYKSTKYMLYEAKEIEQIQADLSLTELSKEFTRLANKEDRVTECTTTHKWLQNALYLESNFESNIIENNRRRKEVIKIVYLPSSKEVLISYTGSKYEKLVFLDTFLRIVCKDGYLEKVQSYDLTYFKQQDFDFAKANKDTPLLTWKIKNITFSFGDEKLKKKIRLTLPSSRQENGLQPLFAFLEEIGSREKYNSATIENVGISFYFPDKRKSDKSVGVNTSISLQNNSLCPLFFYHNYGRALLKTSGIDKGFVDAVKKEKENVTKKWEV